METLIGYGIVVIASIILSNIGLLLVRRWVPSDAVKPSHEVGGYLFAALATLYAVLLGLIVVDAMGKFQEAGHIAEQESNCVARIFFLAEQLPNESRQKIQGLCKKYVQLVVDKEWDAMNNKQYCPEARSTALTLLRSVFSVRPTNEAENAIYAAAIDQVGDMWTARRARILMATRSLPEFEWFVVLSGGIATVIFTYFFGTEQLRVQIAMTSMVTFLISLNIILLWMFGQPFHGDSRVLPDSFRGDIRIFDGDLTQATTLNGEAG